MRMQGLIFALISAGSVLAQSIPSDEHVETRLDANWVEHFAAGTAFDFLDPAAYGFLAPVLAAWISNVRDDAVERGANKITNEIREALADFVPHEVLNSVRWSIDGHVLSIGQVEAATFDHVILFASADAAMDLKVWVHELFHVMQYREWGVDEFARRYIQDRANVENDAWDFLWQWIDASN
jgi:hypothetical protein